jgi:RNA polymerase primary sigma factor
MANNDLLTTYLQGMLTKGIKTLSKDEEYELATQIANGDEKALETLITHNLRLVVFVIRKMTAWNYSAVPAEDLIQMGNEALILAAAKWTPTKGARFAAYAGNYITRYVTRQLDNTERLIRLPVNIVEAIKRMNYLDRTLKQSLGREPTPKELAALMGVSTRRISQLRGYIQREPVSLDAILNDMHEEGNEE